MSDLRDSVTLPSLWPSLERIRGLSAVPAIWRRHLGEDYAAFNRAFLLVRPEPAKSFPCDQCGCAHEVITCTGSPLPIGLGGSGVRAVCTCEPWNCADLILSAADVQV